MSVPKANRTQSAIANNTKGIRNINKARTKQRRGDITRRRLSNHRSDALDPRHRLLQPVETIPLLHIPTLQHSDSLFQSRARLALLRYHLVGLAEQLHRQLLEFGVRLRQLSLCGATEVLFPVELVLQCGRYVRARWRGQSR